MSTIVDTDWIRAVLHRHALTRHLHVDVLEGDDEIVLQGLVPTRIDRAHAGTVARSAASPGLTVINDIKAEDDMADHLYAPRWHALYQQSVATLAA